VSLAYYFDYHVPGAICEGLRQRGISVITAAEDGRSDWPDDEILARATHLGRLVFTQDADFLVIANEWATVGRPHAGIVYGHQLQITIGQAIRDLELIARIMEGHEMANRVEFLPLR
jgi:predicted nuclease of predicted toxin-antitoxin system